MRALVGISVVACACNATGVVEVTIPGTPSYVVYRDSRGTWLTPEHEGNVWRLDVEDDYELWSVCTGLGDAFYSQGLRATLDDGLERSLEPYPGLEGCSDPSSGGAPLRVTGAMLQAGTIASCAGTQTSVNPTGWLFELPAQSGRCDLIASDFDHTTTLAATYLAHWELELDGDLEVEPVDLFRAIPLGQVTVPIVGTWPDGLILGSVTLTAGNTSAQIAGLPGDSSMLAVPLVDDQDGIELAHATVLGDNVRQDATVRVTPNLSAITMLAPAPAEWVESTQSITWRAIDDRHTAVELAIDGDSCATCTTRAQRVVASQRWLDAHRDRELAFPADLPGFDPAWRIETTGLYRAYFRLIADDGESRYVSSTQIHPSETAARSAR